MPEILKQQNYSVCDRLDNFCQECIANNYQDCSDHGGRDSTVLGKRRVGDNVIEDFSRYWNNQGACKKKGDTKSKRTNDSAEARALLENTINDHNGGQDPPEGHDGGDQDNCLQGGGVRYRENLKKYVVEYRPPRFKWKLWMGTFPTQRDGQRAFDCAKYYAGQDNTQFYFPDSPGLFKELGPLTKPFSEVSRETKDRDFNQELKKRAKEVIKKEADAKNKNKNKLQKPQPKARTSVRIAHPSCMFQDVEHQTTASIHLSPLSQEFGVLTPESVAIADPYCQGSAAAEVLPDDDLCNSSKEAVLVAREYADSAFEGLDTLETLPEVHHHYHRYHPYNIVREVLHHQQQSPYYVPEFDMVENGLNHPYPMSTPSLPYSDYATGDQESEEDMCLWNHDR